MTTIICAIFALLSLGATVFGAVTLQLGLAAQGVLFFGLFLVAGSIAGTARNTQRDTEDILDRLEELTKKP